MSSAWKLVAWNIDDIKGEGVLGIGYWGLGTGQENMSNILVGI